jgi:uncharacterized protein (TIGR03083 family)
VAEPLVPVTNDQRAALLGLLTNVPSDDWGRTTGCRDWPVHDVVAHVVEGELLFGRVYRGELKGLSREDTDPQAGVDRWTRADADTLRFSLWHHGTATQRVIDSRSAESWDRKISLFGRPARLRELLHLHFFDLALHSMDISAALSAPSLWGDRIPAIVEFCLRGAPDALAARSFSAADGLRVEVDGAGSWILVRRDGAWHLDGVDGVDATLSWITDPETLVRATTGRLPPAEAIERSKVEGDPAVLVELVAAWQVKSG